MLLCGVPLALGLWCMLTYVLRIDNKIPIDGVCLWVLFLEECDRTFREISTWSTVLWFIIGLTVAGLERFCVGWAFHCTPRIGVWHEDFHEQLRRRKISHIFLALDHLVELCLYLLIFGVYNIILAILPWSSNGFWMGLLVEHCFGFHLRFYVQYAELLAPNTNNAHSIWTLFLLNAHTYYWYHILIAPQTCFGFSSPFWDKLAKRHPFVKQQKSMWPSFPLPFVDFWLHDYTAYSAEIGHKLKEYEQDPVNFKQKMIEKIQSNGRL